MNCKYKVKIKRIQYNYRVQMAQLQGKYKFNIFCTGGNKELEEKVNTLYEAWPRVSGTGETITLNNTVAGKMLIDLKGNTSQDGTPTPDSPVPIQVVSGDNSINVCGKNILYYTNQTTSWAGAKINTNGNTITYTPNDSGQGGMGHTTSIQRFPIPSGTTLTYSQRYVSGSVWTSGSLTNAIRLMREDGTHVDKSFGDITPSNYQNIKKITFTTDEDFVGITCYSMIYAGSGMTTPLVYNVQLEYNSDITDFEPYQSASYPINLEVENLWNLSTTYENTTSSNKWVLADTDVSFPPGIYTFSCNNTNTTSNNVMINFKDSNNVEQTISLATSKTITFTNEKVKVAIRLNANTTISNIQLEKGSKANSYTPYGTTSIELCKIGDYQDSIKKSTGKNLFNGETELGTISQSDGVTISSSGTVLYTPSYTEILPSTQYTFSFGGTNLAVRLFYYNSNKEYISTDVYSVSGNNFTFTTLSNAKYIRYQFNKAYDINFQLEKGSSATSYEPYGTSWYLNKQIGKYTNPEWHKGSSANVDVFYSTSINNYATSNNIPLSNNFIGVTNVRSEQNMRNQIGKIAFRDSQEYIRLYVSSELTETELNNLNTIVYYVLDTPTYTEITDSTLLSQLEAIKEAESYSGQTNISQTNDDKPFILTAKALKDLSNL